MGRLVQARQQGAQIAEGKAEGDTYATRVAKYVPSEIIAAYVAINGFSLSASEAMRFPIWVANFVLCLVMTPVYLNLQADRGEPKGQHLAIATLAFVFWAYAIGGDSGLFGKDGCGWYQAALASIALVVFTLVSGLQTPEKSQH